MLGRQFTDYMKDILRVFLYLKDDDSVFSLLSWCRYQMDAFDGRYDKLLIENENLL